jgi:hypothetical protein
MRGMVLRGAAAMGIFPALTPFGQAPARLHENGALESGILPSQAIGPRAKRQHEEAEMTTNDRIAAPWRRRGLLKAGAAGLATAGSLLPMPYLSRAGAQDASLKFWQFTAPGG